MRFIAEKDKILNTFDQSYITKPAIIIDNYNNHPILLKIGDSKNIINYYNTMISKYNTLGLDKYAETIYYIELFDKLSINNITNILNIIVNCTGHPILTTICNNDLDTIYKYLT